MTPEGIPPATPPAGMDPAAERNALLHVVHLEDDANDAELVRELLSAGGIICEIQRVDDRERFLTALEGNVDLVLADLSLPDFDGLTALALTRGKHPDLPFIFVSGNMGEEAAIDSLKEGATDYVLKTRLARLVPAVTRALVEAETQAGKRRAEEAIRRAKEEWERTFDAISDPMMILDQAFRIRKVNRAMSDRLGMLPAEAIGMSCYTLVHGLDAPPTFCPHARALSDDVPHSVEIEEPRLGGCYLVTVSPLHFTAAGGGGEVVAGIEIMRDISERKKNEEQIRRQLGRITALRNIDLAISSSGDLRVTLDIILNQVRAQLYVDAAAILLLSDLTKTLELAAAQGFVYPDAIAGTTLRIGAGFAGRAALERETIFLSPMGADDVTHSLRAENFVAYCAIPLIAKGAVIGILELFHRSLLSPDSEWSNLADAMAGQAAIAIDNSRMFEKLERSNAGLIFAYDSTIAALSRALDLRDRETEGHSRRVTEMTVRIGRALQMPDEELNHVRRGALLHDIGKMGIPDAILLKPAPLTDDEWRVMVRHPEIAYDMLSPIAFLRPALDIPYSHHEHWDGSGYPQGLKGGRIPFPARIFAVVDIWDALRSDRPYRRAWDEERVRAHLRELAGKHLDPDMVETFLSMHW